MSTSIAVKILDGVRSGRREGVLRASRDGRIVFTRNEPLPDGGWVSTHEDVTEQRRAEEERAAIQASRSAASAIDSAIQGFRTAGRGTVGAVGGSASAMRATADALFGFSEHTSASRGERGRRLPSRLQPMSKRPRSPPTNCRSSIAEISRQLTQTSDIVALAAQEARTTDDEIAGLAEGAQKIGDVVKLIRDIAGQTNLLALNATIEAARAGEAGQGICRRRLGSEIARGADGESDRGYRQPNSRRAGVDRPARSMQSGTSPRACRRSTSYTAAVAASVEEQNVGDRRDFAQRRRARRKAPAHVVARAGRSGACRIGYPRLGGDRARRLADGGERGRQSAQRGRRLSAEGGGVSSLVPRSIAQAMRLDSMRQSRGYAWLAAVFPSAACAAASRAIGTRNGEQDT